MSVSTPSSLPPKLKLVMEVVNVFFFFTLTHTHILAMAVKYHVKEDMVPPFGLQTMHGPEGFSSMVLPKAMIPIRALAHNGGKGGKDKSELGT